MTIQQLAALFNITGTFVAWLIALALLRGYPYPFFRAWTGACGFGVLVAGLELLASFGERPAWQIVCEVAFTVASASLLNRTRQLLDDRPSPPGEAPILTLAAAALSLSLTGLGFGFEAVIFLPLAFLTFSFIRLGLAMLRLGLRKGNRGAIWPAIPLIVHGGVIWLAPVLLHFHALWLGFWLVGIVDTLAGVGMIVFVLEETAWQLRTRNAELTGAHDRLNRYRILAERARDIILVLDLRGRVVEANQAASSAYGYSYDELLSKSLWDLRAPDTLSQLDGQLALAEASGLLLETRHIKKDGTIFPVEVSTQGMDLEGRRVLVSIIRDISERQRMEAILREQNTRLKELDRLKGDFINAASHELRTPLTSIMGYAEFLEDEVAGPLSGEQKAFVGQIQDGALRLQRIIDDMLDFARLEAGTFTLVLHDSEIGAVVRAEASSMAPQARDARITLEVSLPEEPITVRMDPRRIGQVLLNLLSNAIKFTPAGGRISVRVIPLADSVRLEIQDSGIGIGPEHLPRLFEKFFQVDPSTTRERGGAGLGLAISKALVDAHEGRMGVESALGNGTTFWLELPRPAPAQTSFDRAQALHGEGTGLD